MPDGYIPTIPEKLPVMHIRLMSSGDLGAGLGLSRQAGWNQTEADWSRVLFLQPDGCFVAERNGAPVGTVATCIFGTVAWIAMVLVEETLRGQGIGKALMTHALEFLDRRDIRTVRLDATPLGLPLYEKLGFASEYRLDRYMGRLAGIETPSIALPMSPDPIDGMLALDRAVTGTERGKLLRRLAAERPESLRVVRRGDDVDGFLMARFGSRALHIGPCIAQPEVGVSLLVEAWRTYAGRDVFIDVPSDHAEAQASARAAGLTIQRHLTRMRRGDRLTEQLANLWATFGPEKG
jgi:predicted N-acetyltransferase YhbS